MMIEIKNCEDLEKQAKRANDILDEIGEKITDLQPLFDEFTECLEAIDDTSYCNSESSFNAVIELGLIPGAKFILDGKRELTVKSYDFLPTCGARVIFRAGDKTMATSVKAILNEPDRLKPEGVEG